MPDRHKHRGRHPDDDRLFSRLAHTDLKMATEDLSWLLTRNYTTDAALKLVGDRYRLTARQRMAVRRGAASDDAVQQRLAKRCTCDELAGQVMVLDGYNVLITAESVLGGAVLIGCRDGCIRDLASLHGTYRTVEETRPGILLVGHFLQERQPSHVSWYLDAPVSNSGRVAQLIREVASANNWNWQAELMADPDPRLAQSTSIVATSDSWVLDRCSRWFNLAGELLVDHRTSQGVIWLA